MDHDDHCKGNETHEQAKHALAAQLPLDVALPLWGALGVHMKRMHVLLVYSPFCVLP